MENKIQIPKSVKSESFLKRQAHCGECKNCIYDNFSRSYRCMKHKKSVIDSRTFACSRFHYKQADINPNWENEFIFTDRRTW